MTYTQEKIMFGTSSLTAAGFSTLGAMISAGELRWICVTLTVSIITSSFLALIFKRTDETIRLVVGRSGMSILAGIFGSKYLAHSYSLTFAETDIVALGALSCICCIAGFIIGYVLLQTINKNANKLADAIMKKWFP